eukprot:CAMPEP_0177190752 /NCGR_PEP_ID=MMETSP0367-20130122/20991_1 /TAXON_ID=447022 ORGANISM="Scrippsiella hangoei-like, Strain SHHI-4" /NCGR_SAMPLE_ID=MMETSP0367 /ASSEMBLY_ACC=CAM_ASM_000362 /LENGTH=109 /DNA_ID=CAMNT_0018638421 /DNA_START=396 /DNA_END=726 /DNA_ORIENTATION=-
MTMLLASSHGATLVACAVHGPLAMRVLVLQLLNAETHGFLTTSFGVAEGSVSASPDGLNAEASLTMESNLANNFINGAVGAASSPPASSSPSNCRAAASCSCTSSSKAA